MRNGLTVPLKFTPRFAAELASSRAGRSPCSAPGATSSAISPATSWPHRPPPALAEWMGQQDDSHSTGATFRRSRSALRSHGGQGHLHPDDAREAIAHGADAIIVPNHGGRQLDGAPSTIRVLPRIVDAVNGRCEIYLDSGVRPATT